ncbi:MAG: hypothetical protein M3Z36_11745 [Acidobacteriota bacterium]|nr:hypothetical protein [Acidobacteriota bacterium]
MKKIFSQGLVIFAGIVAVPALSTQADQNLPVTADWPTNDARFQAIQSYFHANDCPVEILSQVFLYESDTHGLDWRLLPSLAVIESSGGKAYRGNNLFGWDRGDRRFDTLSAGIHEVASRLADSELYRDKDLDDLLSTYNTHAGYPSRVKSVMRRMSATIN